jgi:hypothetical protein
VPATDFARATGPGFDAVDGVHPIDGLHPLVGLPVGLTWAKCDATQVILKLGDLVFAVDGDANFPPFLVTRGALVKTVSTGLTDTSIAAVELHDSGFGGSSCTWHDGDKNTVTPIWGRLSAETLLTHVFHKKAIVDHLWK